MQSDYGIWVLKAKDNLKWANDNLKLGNCPLVCYLSQQAVELLLKGYLYSKGSIPPKSHNLVMLAKLCEGYELKKVGKLLPKLAILSEFYFESRYPDSIVSELNDRYIAADALESAKDIYKEIIQQLSE